MSTIAADSCPVTIESGPHATLQLALDALQHPRKRVRLHVCLHMCARQLNFGLQRHSMLRAVLQAIAAGAKVMGPQH